MYMKPPVSSSSWESANSFITLLFYCQQFSHLLTTKVLQPKNEIVEQLSGLLASLSERNASNVFRASSLFFKNFAEVKSLFKGNHIMMFGKYLLDKITSEEVLKCFNLECHQEYVLPLRVGEKDLPQRSDGFVIRNQITLSDLLKKSSVSGTYQSVIAHSQVKVILIQELHELRVRHWTVRLQRVYVHSRVCNSSEARKEHAIVPYRSITLFRRR